MEVSLKEHVTVAVVGLGGYGEVYLEGLLDKKQDPDVSIVAGIDPYPERCSRLDTLKDLSIPIYPDIETFYQQGGTADLVILSSPIQLHRDHSCLAMEHGSNVLCEKPLGGTIQEAQDMIDTRDETGKFVAIGYQWSFTDPVQSLKRDIQNGVFGAPKTLKTLALWPRDESYYARNSWAGKQKDPQGRWILDSPVNNAVAHYLHNMFFVLGDRFDNSARPTTVTAELYRANPIENYDTAVLKTKTTENVDILFVVSHAIPDMIGPVKQYEFENATIHYNGLFSEWTIEFKSGQKETLPSPDPDQIKKMWDCIDAVRTGEPIACGPEAASMQTLCMNGAQLSSNIHDFPKESLEIQGEEGKRLTVVKGLDEVLKTCFEQSKFPSELGASWALPGKPIDLTQLDRFDI